MARYTCSYIVTLPWEQLEANLTETLKSCNCDLIYNTSDYIMARESPGKVPFARLVTVEVLIDNLPPPKNEQVQLDFVVKNEELPLQVNNHCHKMFDLVQQLISDKYQWKLAAKATD